MESLFFHTFDDLLFGALYAVMLVVVAAGPAILDRYWMKLQKQRGKAPRGGVGLHSPLSWLSMFTIPLSGVCLFIILALMVRDGLALLELR